MAHKKNVTTIKNEISNIQMQLNAKNESQKSALIQSLFHIRNDLQKHIIDKQRILDKYIEKLDQTTTNIMAQKLLSAINIQLKNTGELHSKVLKLENQDNTVESDPNYVGVLLKICSEFYNVLYNLDEIEYMLNNVMI